jgi:hypothetical protein
MRVFFDKEYKCAMTFCIVTLIPFISGVFYDRWEFTYIRYIKVFVRASLNVFSFEFICKIAFENE